RHSSGEERDERLVPGLGQYPVVTPQMRMGGKKENMTLSDSPMHDWIMHGGMGHIGRRGFSLSGSYRQGYSTAYNTRAHIKVVCNGYIPAHVLNCNSRGGPRTLPSWVDAPSCMTCGHRPIYVLVKCARVGIARFLARILT